MNERLEAISGKALLQYDLGEVPYNGFSPLSDFELPKIKDIPDDSYGNLLAAFRFTLDRGFSGILTLSSGVESEPSQGDIVIGGRRVRSVVRTTYNFSDRSKREKTLAVPLMVGMITEVPVLEAGQKRTGYRHYIRAGKINIAGESTGYTTSDGLCWTSEYEWHLLNPDENESRYGNGLYLPYNPRFISKTLMFCVGDATGE